MALAIYEGRDNRKESRDIMQIRDRETSDETWPRKANSPRTTFKLIPVIPNPALKNPNAVERIGEEVIEELGEPVEEPRA